MVSVKAIFAAATAVLTTTAAYAADLPSPQIPYQPAPVVEAPSSGGWYLRGDIGVGLMNFRQFDHSQTNPLFVWPASWSIVQKDIQNTNILGFGIGYEVNNWLRFDVTGEERTKASFKATGSYTEFCPGGTCFDVNSGNYSSAVFMVNAYVDLGTWWCLTPYIGGGIGTALNRITGVQDLGLIANGTNGFGFTTGDASNWSMAWNLQAGLTYNVSSNFKVDFSYRFLNLGSAQTAVVACQNTNSCPGASYTLKDITSQDFRIGLRWMLQPEIAPAMAPAPLMSRG